jgi:hypothetical protein
MHQVRCDLAYGVDQAIGQKPAAECGPEAVRRREMTIDSPIHWDSLGYVTLQALAGATTRAENGGVVTSSLLRQGKAVDIMFSSAYVVGQILVDNVQDPHAHHFRANAVNNYCTTLTDFPVLMSHSEPIPGKRHTGFGRCDPMCTGLLLWPAPEGPSFGGALGSPEGS